MNSFYMNELLENEEITLGGEPARELMNELDAKGIEFDYDYDYAFQLFTIELIYTDINAAKQEAAEQQAKEIMFLTIEEEYSRAVESWENAINKHLPEGEWN